MFDYTKAALKKVVDDFKKILFSINVGTQILTISYLIFALFTGMGIFVANVILFTLALSYFIFFLYMEISKKKEKELKRRVKEIYAWCKRFIKFLSIGITAYGLFLTNSNFSLLPFALLLFTIVGWVLELLFYFICKFLEAQTQLIIEGFQTDIHNYTKPIRAVGNFVKRLSGKETEEPAPTKNRELLTKLVAKDRAQKKQEKAQKRTEQKAKFSLWMQDKFGLFKPKKDVIPSENLDNESIPAPEKHELLTDFIEEEV